jgi:hypothetical protein
MNAVVVFVYHAAAVAIDVVAAIFRGRRHDTVKHPRPRRNCCGSIAALFRVAGLERASRQMSKALTGRYSNITMWYLAGGVVGVVAGAALLFRSSLQD